MCGGNACMRDGVRRVCVFFFLSLACGAQQADLTSIRLTAEKFHNAYAAKDLDAVVSLWSDASPQKASQIEEARKLLSSAAVAEIRETTVRDPEWAGAHARLRVDRDVVSVSSGKQSAGGAPGAGKAKLILEWVKDGQEWKIWKETPAAEDLAARLADLPAAGKQDELLAANEDLAGADLALALISHGTSARNQGDLPKALAILVLARNVAERTGSTAALALALNHAGVVYHDQGDYPRALENYRHSLALSEELHDGAGASRALSNLSGLYSGIGELTVASEYLDKSLLIAESLHDNRLITNALGNMAVTHARRGDYLKALTLLQKCSDLLKTTTDKRGQAANLNNIGNVYLWQGDLAQAQDYFQRELEVATAAGLKPLIAVAWMGLGRVAEARGELRNAIASYEKSLAILAETGNKAFAASGLTFIGSAYSTLGEHEKAIEYFQKGLEIQKAIGEGSEAILSMGRIAEVYNRMGNFGKALDLATEARTLADASGQREAAWQADLQAGRASQGVGQNAQAEIQFRQAIATIEALREGVAGSESEQETFFESKLEPFQRLLGLLVASGRNAEAFDYAERTKARVLLDVFRNGKAELSALMGPEEHKTDQALRVRLGSLNAQMVQAHRGNSPSQVAELTTELTRARREYERFENELYVRHPRWRAPGGAVEPVGIEQALALMPDSETAFIEFVATDDRLYLFVAGGSRFEGSPALRAITVPVTKEALTQQVQLFQRQLAARNLGFRSTASALYQILIAPAGIDLAHTRHLILVPDGVLWELPFQALVNPGGRYLLDDCSVSYAPSLTALKTMIEVKRQRRDSTAGTGLLAMGDPALERGLESRVKALYRDETFDDIPLARTEVRNLGRIYGEQSRIYVGPEARESRFKAEASSARVLHLATHAVLNNASPLYSYLLLVGEATGLEDGLLEGRELLSMNLSAELVVLSACETARGHVSAGEGVIGLSWALLVSGVPTLVVSQWRVASDSTSIFMTAFHQNRNKKMSDAEALRAAALSLRKIPAYQHPFYWAPFTLIGAGLN